MYIILLCIREMDEHTCYVLSLRSTFLQTVNMTSKNILLEYSIKRLMIAFLFILKKMCKIIVLSLIPQHFFKKTI